MNVTLKNCSFGILILFLLIASINHTNYITENTENSDKIYYGALYPIVVSCLFIDIALVIFSLTILGNLNDFILKRIPNLIGACQKLRIVSVNFII
jgi:hypothetical protein